MFIWLFHLIVLSSVIDLTSYVDPLSLQLHIKEDALVNFKSELAVLELEIQVTYFTTGGCLHVLHEHNVITCE